MSTPLSRSRAAHKTRPKRKTEAKAALKPPASGRLPRGEGFLLQALGLRQGLREVRAQGRGNGRHGEKNASPVPVVTPSGPESPLRPGAPSFTCSPAEASAPYGEGRAPGPGRGPRDQAAHFQMHAPLRSRRSFGPVPSEHQHRRLPATGRPPPSKRNMREEPRFRGHSYT